MASEVVSILQAREIRASRLYSLSKLLHELFFEELKLILSFVWILYILSFSVQYELLLLKVHLSACCHTILMKGLLFPQILVACCGTGSGVRSDSGFGL